jgi:hypothetical protein
MSALAQLAVQRSGRLDWLRSVAGSGGSGSELWTLQPAHPGAAQTTWSARRIEGHVPPGSWLGAEPRGRVDGPGGGVDDECPALVQAPAAATAAPLTAALLHPRTGAWFLGTETSLEEQPRGRVHALVENRGVAAMTLSTDQRRLYFVSPQGELFMLPVMPLGLDDAAASADEPECLLGDLGRHGEPCGLALGPAGLVLATHRAVVGINLRSRSVAPILGQLADHPACAALRAPAVAMDHRRNLYLADERAVVCAPGHGTPPYVCAQP